MLAYSILEACSPEERLAGVDRGGAKESSVVS